MESDSSLNTTINVSALVLLPIGAVAFAPFLLLQLVAAIVSNAILLALVILACVKKLNNNINIYLFSLAIGGLIGAIDIFFLLSIVVARRWVLGLTACNISRYLLNVYNVFFVFLYLVISRDKLKVVKNPLHARPTKRRASIASVLIWIAANGGGTIIYLTLIWHMARNSSVDYGNFVCLGFTNERIEDSGRFIRISSFVIIFWIINSIIIVTTLSNFMRILLEMRRLKKLRQQFANESSQTNQTSQTSRIKGHDKPLYPTGEERTAKSLILVYFINFSCNTISLLMFYPQTIRNLVLSPEEVDGPDIQIYFVIPLMINLFPCVNPVFLILSNKRLRTRVKDLFKCTLSPEVEASPVHLPTVEPKPPVLLDLKTNKIVPLKVSMEKHSSDSEL